MITVLAGGVGAARFLRGLVEVVDPSEIAAVVNTADDFALHGLAISPDLDSLMYTLAGDSGKQGWGRSDETWRAMSELRRFAVAAPPDSRATDWFNLGDRDLATHLYRTQRLSEGANLTQVTREMCDALGLAVSLLPMSNDPVATMLTLQNGDTVDFQEYFVKRRHSEPVSSVNFHGASTAKPSLEALDAIQSADRIVIAPSNPILSIAPIFAIKELDSAVRSRRDQCVAVSPLIAGRAVKGPADHLLAELGHQANAVGIAELWRPYASHLVIDDADIEHMSELAIPATATHTLMSTLEDARHLVEVVLAS